MLVDKRWIQCNLRRSLSLSLRTWRWVVPTACAAVSCSPAPAEQQTATAKQPVEYGSLLDGVYDLSLPNLAEPVYTRAPRLERHLSELAGPSLASGALLIPAVDLNEVTRLRTAPDGTELRATCGITFVSPSLAFTAAHCVPSPEVEPPIVELQVEMYRPHSRLRDSIAAAARLTGTFPDWRHSQLTAAEGYHRDRYPCVVEATCGTSYGNVARSCGTGDDVDQALIRCEGQPGLKYGYLNVAAGDDPSAPIFMPWAHEVLDASPQDADHLEHYVSYVGFETAETHFHYFGQGRNDLLPLRSVDWPGGEQHRRAVSPEPEEVGTDFFGCHGTSGAGVVQRNSETGVWEYLGAIVHGGEEIGTYLCDRMERLVNGELARPGNLTLTYLRSEYARLLMVANQEAWLDDCHGDTSLGGERIGALDGSRACTPFSLDRPWTDSKRSPVHALPSSGVLLESAGEVLRVDGFSMATEASYVLSLVAEPVSLTPGGASCAQGCPELSLTRGGRTWRPLAINSQRAHLRVLLDSVQGVAPLLLTLGGRPAEVRVSAIAVARVGAPLSFDHFEDRLAVSLFALASDDSARPMPARFDGDEQDGFMLLLRERERAALLGLAFYPGPSWSLSWDSDDTSGMVCGWLGADGSELSRGPCPQPGVDLGAVPAGKSVAGVYIESTETPLWVDNIQLTPKVPPGACQASDCDSGVGDGGGVFSPPRPVALADAGPSAPLLPPSPPPEPPPGAPFRDSGILPASGHDGDAVDGGELVGTVRSRGCGACTVGGPVERSREAGVLLAFLLLSALMLCRLRLRRGLVRAVFVDRASGPRGAR